MAAEPGGVYRFERGGRTVNTFVIEYDPIGANAHFYILSSNGVCVGINDSEELKIYENEHGLFNLEGQHDKIFRFLQENFDGESEVAVEIKSSKAGIEAREADFRRFTEATKRFNKNSEMKVTLKISQSISERSHFIDRYQTPSTGATPGEGAPSKPQEKVTESCSKPVCHVPAGPISAKPSPPLKKKIAVVGKIKSGKTNLITGMVEFLNSSYILDQCSMHYVDKKNNTEWYEVKGIDLEKASIEYTKKAIDTLIASGVSSVLYCLHSMLGKIEDAERDLIVEIQRNHPDVRVFAVITACIDEERSHEFANTVSLSTKQTKVFTVLAKEMPTKAGYVEPRGLAEMASVLFGEL